MRPRRPDLPGRVPAELNRLKKTAVLAIATGLGSGYSPFAPGTAGSVVGLAAAWLAAGLGSAPYAAVCLLLLPVGAWTAGHAEDIYGAKDCGKITIDEVLGMMLTLWLLPVTPFVYVTGFFLFRFFDISKPFPAGWIDRHLPGGLGVMLDDVVAGIYANISLRLLTILVA